MAELLFSMGAAESWGKMVNYSRNFENRSGSNVLLRIMKMTKKTRKMALFASLKVFLFFRGDDVVDVRGDVGKWGRRYAVSGKR